MAKAFMRKSPCRWVDIALTEGWGKSLEELVRSAIRETLRRGNELPSMSAMDKFPVRAEEHAYFARNGQQYYPAELEEIRAARKRLMQSGREAA